MAIKKIESVKLGMFVTIIFILFTYGVYRVGNSQTFLGNKIELFCEFDDVMGLRAGNNVRFNGIVVGTVNEISFVNPYLLSVSLEVDKSMTKYMQKNAVAKINSDGLVGNMVVNIRNLEEGNTDFISPGDVIKGVGDAGIDSVMRSLSGTNDKIIRIVDNLVEVTQSISDGEGTIATLLHDPDITRDFKSSMTNLNNTISRIGTITKSLEDIIVKAQNGEGNLGYLLVDNSLSEDFSKISQNLDSLTSEKVDPILKDMSETSESLKVTVHSIREIIEKMQGDDLVLNHLLYDTSMMHNINTSLQQINDGTLKFDEIMGALQEQWLIKRLLRKYKDDKE